jgi:hypothetical protein
VAFNVAPDNVPAAAVTVIAAEPSKFTPLIARAVCKVVAVEALPVSAPTKAVDVTDAKPANVVTVAPSDTAVEPIVTELLVRDPLPILDKVLVEPEIDLLVRVSVVALPTNVSVAAGRVKVVVPAIAVARTVVVPEVEPLNVAPVAPIVGSVKVLFVRVCEPVNVATVLSILKVIVLFDTTESRPVPPVNVSVSVPIVTTSVVPESAATLN